MSYINKTGTLGVVSSVQPVARTKPYTLTDLRNDDEFVKVTERYLKSIGEGENVKDLFQYFRGSDFNLYDTHKVWQQSKNFTDQQKKDFQYLQSKFNNAKVGGFGERLQLGIDVAQELASDPITLASAFFIPWTGGQSVVGRLAAGKAAQAGLKSMVAEQTTKSVLPKGVRTLGQQLEKPLTNKQLYGILSAEGFGYGGTYDYITQSRQLEMGEIDDIDLSQTATSGTIAALAAPALVAGGKSLIKIPKKLDQIEQARINKIDNNEGYKPTLIEKGTQKVLKYTQGAFYPIKATTVLINKAKGSETLKEVLKLFRYDADQGFLAPKLGTQEVLKQNYDESFRQFTGNYQERLDKILRDNKLYDLGKKEVPLPFTSGSWINPLMNKSVKTRKSLKFYQVLSDEVNNDLVYFLRSGKKTKPVEISKGKYKQVKLDANIVKAGTQIRAELKSVIDQAKKAGLKVGTVKDFFPRFWRTDVIKNNPEEFISLVKKYENLTDDQALSLWRELSTEGTDAASSAAGFNSRLQASRKLTKIDDAAFGKFLDNDVKHVLDNYYEDAGRIITRTSLLGETRRDFERKFVNKIQKELGIDNALDNIEKQYLFDLYDYTTGVKGRINTSTVGGKLGKAFHDFMTVTMQTSMLTFATLTSVAELGVPLLKGSNVKIGLKAMKTGIADSASEWWKTQKVSWSPYLKSLGDEFEIDANIDVRSQNRQDMNAFFTSVNSAKEDRLVSIYGQAVGKTATKAQNAFFKTIGLYDWTRFVQLVGYDMGKSIIYRNLKIIDDFNKGIIKNNKANKADIARLTDELAELNINVDDGLKWIKRGARHTDEYFTNNVRAGAVRYTNEVVMNPTAASAQKPLLHLRPVSRWIYGLMGFPTAFSNTVLRNVVRNATRDARTLNAGSLKVSSINSMSAALFMTQVGILNHTFRTGGKNLEQYEAGEISETDLILKGLSYSGLMGPGEMYYRYSKAKDYESKISAALSSVVGPNLPDIIDYLGIVQSRGGLAEIGLKRAPFSLALKSLHRETYDEAMKIAREIDKNSFYGRGEVKSKPDNQRVIKFAKGGIVGQETIEGPDVPFTKENAAERINPFTGEPYRIPLVAGGSLSSKIAAKLTASTTKADKELLESLQKRGQQNIKEVQLKTKEGEEISYDVSKAQKTQIVGTKGTYDKAAVIKKDLGYTGKDVLDYGSGMQLNYAKNILDAETFEPFPKLDKADEIGVPDYILKDEIKKQYDFITSFSVLNTIPPKERAEAVMKIGDSLKINGTALITARPLSSVKTAKSSANISSSELINTSGMYQKGYSPKELGQYLIQILGNNFEVSSIPSKYGLSGEGVLLRRIK